MLPSVRVAPFEITSAPVSVPSDAIIVGIPSRNEEATIARVVEVALAGIRSCGLIRRALVINADNGSTDRTTEVFALAATGTSHICVSTPAAGTGKGSNVLAILQIARNVNADRVILFDADVRTIQSDWVDLFLKTVNTPEPTVAVPIYRRNRFEGNTTNHITSPLLAAVFGVDVQQPIAGDFAFNRPFIERVLEWPVPESATLYGIDIHLTANAAREGLTIRQVHLGQKLHNPGFPKILFGSQQVIDSLFHVISASGERPRSVPVTRQPRRTADPVATRPNSDLVVRTVAKARDYLAMNTDAIASVFPTVGSAPRANWGFRIDAHAWAAVLGDALDGLAAGHHAQVRDHLVALYLSRVMTYWEEIAYFTNDEVDALLDEQTDHVVAEVARRGVRFGSSNITRTFEPGYWRQDA